MFRGSPCIDLHKAADAGSVKRLLECMARSYVDNVDQADPAGFTPLVLAAAKGHAHVVGILLDKGANPSLASNEAALIASAQNGHLEVVKLLIEAGAKLEAVTSSMSSTPLHLAAQRGHPEVVGALIEAGANVDSRRSDGATPLVSAATKGHVKVLRLLLDAKADPLLPMFGGDSAFGHTCLPLDMGVQYGHPGVVRELIQRFGVGGCGGDSGGGNALTQAVYFESLEIMALLVGAGVADAGQALRTAATFGRVGPMKFLLARQRFRSSSSKANYASSRDNVRGVTALIGAVDSARSLPCPRIVRLLVDAGADTASSVRFTDRDGVGFDGPPLAYATKVLREKKASGSGAKEEQLNGLEAVRRVLLRVEAARAVSWVWPGGAPDFGHDSSGTRGKTSTSTSTKKMPLAAMALALRRRPLRGGVLLAAQFR